MKHEKEVQRYDFLCQGTHSRDTVQTILPRSNVQRRVSVDVNCVHITIGIQKQHGDVHTA